VRSRGPVARRARRCAIDGQRRDRYVGGVVGVDERRDSNPRPPA
jgi:hypothetical protein